MYLRIGIIFVHNQICGNESLSSGEFRKFRNSFRDYFYLIFIIKVNKITFYNIYNILNLIDHKYKR